MRDAKNSKGKGSTNRETQSHHKSINAELQDLISQMKANKEPRSNPAGDTDFPADVLAKLDAAFGKNHASSNSKDFPPEVLAKLDAAFG